MPESIPFESWAILEMMGHIRTAGKVSEETRFGAVLGRCDVPGPDDTWTTFYFGGSSIFRVTPCSEEAARAVAKGNQPAPVHTYELPKALAAPTSRHRPFEETIDDGEDERQYMQID